MRSFRDAEGSPAERGIDVSNETLRRWSLKFGGPITANLTKARPRPSRSEAIGCTAPISNTHRQGVFQYKLPHERSTRSQWRKRIGDHLDVLFQDNLRVAYDAGALKKGDLTRMTVDTTVPPKNVPHTTVDNAAITLKPDTPLPD